MSENNNKDQKIDSNVNDESIEQNIEDNEFESKGKSMIDSLFFSTATIMVLAVIFFVSSFVSGWYVSSVSDREIKINEAIESINNHPVITEDVKKKKEEDQILDISISNKTAEVNSLERKREKFINDLEKYEIDKDNALADFKKYTTEKNLLEAQIELLEAQIEALNDKIAKKEATKPSLNEEIYDLEEELGKLNAQISQKKEDANNEINESFSSLLLSTRSKLERIEGVEDDFDAAKKQIAEIIDELDIISPKLLASSSDLEDEISNLKSHNQNISSSISPQLLASTSNLEDAVSKLESYNQSISKETKTLSQITQGVKGYNQDWKSSTDLLKKITDNLTKSGNSIDELVNQTQSFRSSIDEQSIKEINAYIDEISKQFEELKNRLEEDLNNKIETE